MRTYELVSKLSRVCNRSESRGRDGANAVLREGALIIECRGCRGAQDLADQGCMRCALKALSGSPSFESLVLSRSQDIAYTGRCIQVLRDLADAVRLCQEGVPPTSERACVNCPYRPSLLLERMADSIPYHWEGQAPRHHPRQPRTRCTICSEKVNDVFCAVLAKLRCIERSSSREAFMVVGESGDA